MFFLIKSFGKNKKFCTKEYKMNYKQFSKQEQKN
jgi:hypothetical protein